MQLSRKISEIENNIKRQNALKLLLAENDKVAEARYIKFDSANFYQEKILPIKELQQKLHFV